MSGHCTAPRTRGVARAQSADDVNAALRSMHTIPDWTGEAADAYETRADTVASGWTAMAVAFRAGQSALEDVAAAIDAARAKAGDAIDLWDRAELLDAAAFQDTPDKSTGWLGPDRRAFLGSAPRAEARAVLSMHSRVRMPPALRPFSGRDRVSPESSPRRSPPPSHRGGRNSTTLRRTLSSTRLLRSSATSGEWPMWLATRRTASGSRTSWPTPAQRWRRRRSPRRTTRSSAVTPRPRHMPSGSTRYVPG